MTRWVAEDGCTIEPGMGGRRDPKCEHGFVYLSPKMRSAYGRVKPRKSSSEPKRDWSLAIAKKEEENDCCRVCGAHGTEAAHILGRRHDQPIAPGSKTLLVLPDRIVPLCRGTFADGCHYHYDRHELDLLPFLTAAEQAQAVLDSGSIESARRRLAPSAYVESLAS